MINKYYFVSKKRLKNNTISPRIPQNRLTLSGKEDNKTKRICVSKSILGCLHSTNIYATNKRIYLYNCIVDTKFVVQPSEKQVSDAKLTGEEWIICDTKMNLEMILHVKNTDINDEYIKYTIKDKDSDGFFNISIIEHK